MTDLIKFLRTSTSSAFNKTAADRIEELERRNAEMNLLYGEVKDGLEDKLAKAVMSLVQTEQAIMLCINEPSWRLWGEGAVSDIRKVLAELEGEPLGAEFEAVWDAHKGDLYEP